MLEDLLGRIKKIADGFEEFDDFIRLEVEKIKGVATGLSGKR